MVVAPPEREYSVWTFKFSAEWWTLLVCCSLPASFVFLDFRHSGEVDGRPADLPSAPRTRQHADFSALTPPWDALNVNVNRTKVLLRNTKRCSNHESPPEQLKSCLVGKNLTQKTVAWSYDMKSHAKKCVESFCELANKSAEQLYKVSTPCLDDHHFTKRTGNGWRTVKSLLSNRREMLKFGPNW